MYHEHFGLQRAPFRITPDTELFYPGGGRGEVLEALVYAVTSGEGIVKVTGEVGTGKTMLCRMLEVRLPASVEVVYIANPSLSPEDILHAIALEMSLPVPPEASRLQVMHALQQRLLAKHSDGRRVVVFVEEAQGMPMATLEEIRLLSNLETQRDKLLQIVLFGQPELDDTLARDNIRQLRERITHSFKLEPLSRDEVREYVRFRMRAVGYRGPDVFKAGAYRLLSRGSEGLVRRVNILADKALLAAFADDTHTVSPRHVKIAIDDGQYTSIGGGHRGWWLAGGALLLAGVLAAVLVLDLAPWRQWLQRYDGALPAAGSSVPAPPPASPEPAAAPVPEAPAAPAATAPGDSSEASEAAPANAPAAVSTAGAGAGNSAATTVVPGTSPAADTVAGSAPVDGAVAGGEAVAAERTAPAGGEDASAERSAPASGESSARTASETSGSVTGSQPVAGPAPESAGSTPATPPAAAFTTAPAPVADTAPAAGETVAGSSASADQVVAESPSPADRAAVVEEAAAAPEPAAPATAATGSESLATAETEPETQAETPANDEAREIPARVAAVDSGNRLLAQRLEATDNWLRGTQIGNFSIQLLLADVARQSSLESFLQRMQELGTLEDVYVYETIIGARTWFGVLYGEYGSYGQAREGLETLPEELRRHKPFIRNVRDITG